MAGQRDSQPVVKKIQQPAKIVKKESSEEDSSYESDDEPKAKQQRVQASKIQQPSKVTKKQSTSEDSSDESEDDEPVKKQSAKIGQSHPTSLTSNLLKLFEPRPPLEYKPPPEKRKLPSYTVVTTLVNFMTMFRRVHSENCKLAEFERKKAKKEAERERMKVSPLKKESEQPLVSPIISKIG